jgi:hypothetical protein
MNSTGDLIVSFPHPLERYNPLHCTIFTNHTRGLDRCNLYVPRLKLSRFPIDIWLSMFVVSSEGTPIVTLFRFPKTNDLNDP